MQIKLSEVNGIFQVDNHTSFSRFLWTILVLTSLSIIFFQAYWGRIDLFGLSENDTLKSFLGFVEALALFGVPIIATVVGLIKIIKKPGVYAVGAWIVNDGVEIGTLGISANSLSPETIYSKTLMANDISGNWKRKKTSIYEAINILIVLRKKQEQSKRYLLERVVISSGGKRLIEMFGRKKVGAKRDTIVAISKGTFHQLGNGYGICSEDLLSFRQLISDIFAGWQPSFALSCTLQTLPSFASLDNIASIGVLGGLNKTSPGPIDHSGSKEIIFSNQNN